MTIHKHAEIIKAKADNMELVVFIKHNNEGEWKLMKYYNFPEFGGTHEYFLCLPQHKEAVLSALNGGESQTYRENSGEWLEAICSHGWNSSYWYMRNDRQSRIKPRKEKRWIAFKWNNFYVLPRHYETKQDAEIAAASSMMGEFQYKEIEIEV